jgi:imidazolonepropionase-like amidohydrolase
MKPQDVLHAATVINAQLMHMPGQIGEVKPGYIADLVVVTGNPLEDISAVRDVQLVIQEGNLIPIFH